MLVVFCISTFIVIKFFFFFKQKTAYEMRISDWSSDVCSSDLRAIIRPTLTIALGATAGRAILGHPVTIGKLRGEVQQLADGSQGWVTVHPSYLLRIRDRDRAGQEYDRFVAELKQAAEIAMRK